jgi:hypothetical protein
MEPQRAVSYSFVLDPIDLRVQLLGSDFTIFSQMMLNLSDFEHSGFFECPCGKLLGELLVDRLRLLPIAGSPDSRRKPLILQTLHGAQDSEPSRVSSLHGRDQSQLRTCSCNILN